MAPCQAGEMPLTPTFIAIMFSPQARHSSSMMAEAEAGRARLSVTGHPGMLAPRRKPPLPCDAAFQELA